MLGCLLWDAVKITRIKFRPLLFRFSDSYSTGSSPSLIYHDNMGHDTGERVKWWKSLGKDVRGVHDNEEGSFEFSDGFGG